MTQMVEPLIQMMTPEQSNGPIRQVMEAEHLKGGIRNLTRVVAHSPMAWQTTSRALQIYLALRIVSPSERDVLCLYTSMLNGCHYCMDDALGEALLHGWTPDQLRNLYVSLSHFSPKLQAALRYTLHLTVNPHDIPEPVETALKAHHSPEEILEITTIVSMKNFWNHFAIALRIPPEGKCKDLQLFADIISQPAAR